MMIVVVTERDRRCISSDVFHHRTATTTTTTFAVRPYQQTPHRPTPTGAGTRPRGLLVLRGEDFGDPHMAHNVTAYVETVKGLIFEHVRRCQGHAVVIFDEVSVSGWRMDGWWMVVVWFGWVVVVISGLERC